MTFRRFLVLLYLIATGVGVILARVQATAAQSDFRDERSASHWQVTTRNGASA